jgi:hypothetical protein
MVGSCLSSRAVVVFSVSGASAVPSGTALLFFRVLGALDVFAFSRYEAMA